MISAQLFCFSATGLKYLWQNSIKKGDEFERYLRFEDCILADFFSEFLRLYDFAGTRFI
jgi:hypothetical protein